MSKKTKAIVSKTKARGGLKTAEEDYELATIFMDLATTLNVNAMNVNGYNEALVNYNYLNWGSYNLYL